MKSCNVKPVSLKLSGKYPQCSYVYPKIGILPIFGYWIAQPIIKWAKAVHIQAILSIEKCYTDE